MSLVGGIRFRPTIVYQLGQEGSAPFFAVLCSHANPEVWGVYEVIHCANSDYGMAWRIQGPLFNRGISEEYSLDPPWVTAQ